MVSRRLHAAGILFLWLAAPASADDLQTRLAGGGRADVFVMLREPQTRGRGLQARRSAISAVQNRVAAAVAGAAVEIGPTLEVVSGFGASVTAAGLAQLRTHPDVVRVDAVKYGSGGLAHSVPQIRADAVHRRDDGGQGVTVAVLDTGVDTAHPDLGVAVVGEHCFCGGACCPNGLSEQSGPGSAHTDFVHGIHVSGIVLSRGRVSAPGVAPQAKLVAVKVLNEENRGTLTDWIRGLDWIASERPDVRAVNMSLVSDAVYEGACDSADAFNLAFAQAIEMLRARGTLVFVSSGNTGELNAMAAPACIHAAVAVGAVDRDDRVADFSDVSSELDILAPGVDIVSSGPRGTTAELTGTSMSAPHVTGTAALILALNPDLNADQLESLLESRGTTVFDDRVRRAFPRVNALAAMTAALPFARPLTGGGSGRTDCFSEWNFESHPEVALAHGVSVTCHDGDPACDADSAAGRCTFRLSTCLRQSDARLPRCSDSPLTAYRVTSPSDGATDPIERANAAAFSKALPAPKTVVPNQCSEIFPILATVERPQWIRIAVTAADGRSDVDHLRFTCLP